jgi:small redox-active disulfide protein 2
MTIEVLGPGCAKCESLVEKTREIANRLGLEYDLVKVKDFNEIAKRGVLVTPALVVDGTVKVIGRVPGDDELAGMLQLAK